MHQFALPLETGIDAVTNLPVLGFSLNGMFITNPFVSECGRFEVDPVETYGLSRSDADQLVAFNKLVDTATQDALNAGCLAIQQALGIETGDVAGVHFSGPDEVRPVAQAMVDYLLTEYRMTRE